MVGQVDLERASTGVLDMDMASGTSRPSGGMYGAVRYVYVASWPRQCVNHRFQFDPQRHGPSFAKDV